MIIEVKNISKFYGGEAIIENVSLKIENNDRIGLIGVNGCGKTTLLNIISRELYPDGGEIISGGGSIGYLKQNPALSSDLNVYDETLKVFSDMIKTEERIGELYDKMSSETDETKLKALSSEYSRLQTDYEQRDGYNKEVKINTVLNGMGFSKEDYGKSVSVLSGGEKTRLSLAKLLLSEPELLILDEPTNHLDFRALNWLEEYLSSYKGAILLVSHDRYFLDRTVNSVAEIYKGKLTRYKGNYSEFVRLKEEKIKFLGKEYEKQQREIASLKDYIARNKVRASTAKSAKSRENTLEKMEIIENPAEYTKEIKIDFDYDIEPGNELLNSEILSLSAGEKTLCENLSLEMRRGEKIAIVGGNGLGKTTFLKALIGKGFYDGKIKWGRNVKISYFEQEAHSFNKAAPLISEIGKRFPMKSDFEIRSALGKYHITEEDVFKSVGHLSGGELAKVKLCVMTLNRGNVLILDEPTNHLDLSAKEVLDRALTDFKGSVIAVSHDRYLLNRFPDAIYELTENGFIKYPGKYDDYVKNKFEQKAPPPEPKKTESNEYHRSKKERAEQVKRKNDIKKCEAEIEAREKELALLEEEIASPETASDYQLLNEKCLKADELRNKINELYEKLEEFGF